ncbi:MAG: 1-deoxy-D-xylulose-5-phosphate reductoisomerase [Opitutaceae bacterium]|nr:1-deoxy-D-xylulose-5-phosphate reductoisomerase [Opitutaceae bacterium]
MSERKKIVLLGATGSIGENTLKVISGHPDKLELVGIAAHSKIKKLAKIAREFNVQHVACFDEHAGKEARSNGDFSADTKFYNGLKGLSEIASLPEADLVVAAVVGTTGLKPVLAAIEAGKDIALANKEILVLAGKFVMAAAKKHDVNILPLDSEHDAIFQCLNGEKKKEVKKLILTASGGSFRERPFETLSQVTPEEALSHPNWNMGKKITVDCSTMANKGLEIIEAHWLFDVRPEQIEVVIHPQSIVHSMVEFVDGSIIAQLSPPSMTFAIQHILLHPDRHPGVEATLDFSQTLSLEFNPPDLKRFPCFALARQALETGGTAPAIFNAANEVAVSAFLANKIGFLQIAAIIDKTMKNLKSIEPLSLDEVLLADTEARKTAKSFI